MKWIKQFLSLTPRFITVALATLQHDVDNIAGDMCPSHSQSIAYENADTHIVLPTGTVVTMMMNYDWPRDANFSISLNTVGLTNKDAGRYETVKVSRNDFADKSWNQIFLNRDFEFVIHPSNAAGSHNVGYVVITEMKTKKFGVFFDVVHVGVIKEYENRGLASKALNAVLEFLDQNPSLGCDKLSILPGWDNIKIGTIYGRQGFWPYIRNNVTEQLTPMSLTKAAEFFQDSKEYANRTICENAFAKFPLMIRHAGADTLSLRGSDMQAEILTKLQQIAECNLKSLHINAAVQMGGGKFFMGKTIIAHGAR